MGQSYDAGNDRLILFSGEDAHPLPRPTDTWVLSDATGASPAWTELSTAGTPPPGNYAHSVVYAPNSNRVVVYGGCQFNCGFALSAVWTLSDANGLGRTPTWTSWASSGRTTVRATTRCTTTRPTV